MDTHQVGMQQKIKDRKSSPGVVTWCRGRVKELAKRLLWKANKPGRHIDSGKNIKRKPATKIVGDRSVPSCVSLCALMSIMVLTAALIFSALCWSQCWGSSHASSGPYEVKTLVGMVKGSVVTRAGYTVVAYKSIPFAKPPIGDLRFQRPQPLDAPADPGVFINTEDYKKSCWSATKTSPDPYYGEDCLYLNVYVPTTMESRSSLPVMVWIHGGGFVAGSTFPEPTKMVEQGQVVMVTVNYRLGVFGFLTSGDAALPSNNGLWDQYLALRWVRENIGHLGGDTSSITVIGESAGGISSGLHVLSPLSSKLFHKAVFQSGTMTSAFISRQPQRVAQKFTQLVGCNTTGSDALDVSCLRNVSIEDILKFSKPEWYVNSFAQRQIDFVFMPVVDGEFIEDDPLKLIRNITYLERRGVFNKDYMIGVLNDEGALLTTNFFYPLPLSDLSNGTFFKDLSDYLVGVRYGSDANITHTVNEAVSTFYTGRAKLTSPPRPASVLDLCGDLAFVAPAVESALAFTSSDAPRRARTFLYHFDFCPASSDSQAPCFKHGDEVELQFPSRKITDPVKLHLSDMFISLLTSFARDSDPGHAVPCGWPQFEPMRRQYLRIAPTADIRSDLYGYRVQFWLDTVPCLMYGGIYCK